MTEESYLESDYWFYAFEFPRLLNSFPSVIYHRSKKKRKILCEPPSQRFFSFFRYGQAYRRNKVKEPREIEHAEDNR